MRGTARRQAAKSRWPTCFLAIKRQSLPPQLHPSRWRPHELPPLQPHWPCWPLGLPPKCPRVEPTRSPAPAILEVALAEVEARKAGCPLK